MKKSLAIVAAVALMGTASAAFAGPGRAPLRALQIRQAHVQNQVPTAYALTGQARADRNAVTPREDVARHAYSHAPRGRAAN